MIKVYAEGEKREPGYTEQWLVTYEEENDKGNWKKKERRYYTFSKNRHRQVEARFRREFPKAKFCKITYQ